MSAGQQAAGGAEPRSALAPLGQPAFAALWLATIVSNIGTWMNDVGAGWLMTTLAPSPFMVSMVQAATTLPVFLLALPAGALADIFDRRRLLVGVNAFMAVVAIAMTIAVAADAMGAEALLLCTFLLGAGAALIAPAWQAIVPSLVEREDLPAAISLNGVGINVSRAIGPALAGVLIVSVGLYAPFAANAASFAAILLVLWFWKGDQAGTPSVPAERMLPAMVAGVRYARRSAPLRRTILRAVCFFVFASAYWALLPLIAKDVLGGGSALYGILLGCVGAGAIGGAFALPALKRRFEPNGVVLIGIGATVIAMLGLALSPSSMLAAAASMLAGAGWICVLSSLHVAAQTSLPNWVRARGLSLFLTSFAGSMAAGSLAWGLVAEALGISTAVLLAGAGLGLVTLPATRLRLPQSDGSEHMPSGHWPEPPPLTVEDGDRGPVVVTIRYDVDTARLADFKALMREVRSFRLRDGAYNWLLLETTERPDTYMESFMVASWNEHLRQHQRVTVEDRELQEAVRALCVDGASPDVNHHLSIETPAKEKTS